MFLASAAKRLLIDEVIDIGINDSTNILVRVVGVYADLDGGSEQAMLLTNGATHRARTAWYHTHQVPTVSM